MYCCAWPHASEAPRKSAMPSSVERIAVMQSSSCCRALVRLGACGEGLVKGACMSMHAGRDLQAAPRGSMRERPQPELLPAELPESRKPVWLDDEEHDDERP